MVDLHNPNIIGTMTGIDLGSSNKIHQGDTELVITDTGTGTLKGTIDGSERLNMTANYQRIGNIPSNDYIEFYAGDGEANPWFRTIMNSDTILDIGPTFVDMPKGIARLGTHDTSRGYLLLYAYGTGSTNGGLIQLETAADYDSHELHYQMLVYEDDFIIGPSSFGNTNGLKYKASGSGATGNWQISFPSSLVRLDIAEDSQVIGNSSDTSITVNQTSNDITFKGNNTTLAVFHPTNGLDFYHNGSKVAETTANGISGAVWG